LLWEADQIRDSGSVATLARGNQPALPTKRAVYPERLRKQQPKGAAPRHGASQSNHGVQTWSDRGLVALIDAAYRDLVETLAR
jgi:hypothetical protein